MQDLLQTAPVAADVLPLRGLGATPQPPPSEPPKENPRSSATSTATSGAAPQGDAAASAAGKPPEKIASSSAAAPESPPEGAPELSAPIDTGAFTLPDGAQAGKASKLFRPPGASAGTPLPAVVVVHGSAAEGLQGDQKFDHAVGNMGRDVDFTWTIMKDTAQAISEQGIIALMIGLPDCDEKHYGNDEAAVQNSWQNSWAAKDYSRFLSAAVDHLLEQAPKHGMAVNKDRIGLVGHSMGGGGVLFAAGNDCKGKVAAVAAVNPSIHSVHSPHDNLQFCERYAQGAPHSGELGEGTIECLAEISAPTYIYGSQAEYNVPFMPGEPPACMQWPAYPCQFAQVGASVKELYVDNMTENWATKQANGSLFLTSAYAHSWHCGEEIRVYGDGKPLAALLGFLRRRLAGTSEQVMERPANAKEWEVLAA